MMAYAFGSGARKKFIPVLQRAWIEAARLGYWGKPEST